MTVCIAAICNDNLGRWPMIIMASDRKYTVGDHWTYEPAQTKHLTVNTHATLLFAGSASALEGVWQEATRGRLLGEERDIEVLADEIATAFARYRFKEAERHVLGSLGMTAKDLLTDPAIPETTSARLRSEMQRWTLDAALILAGVNDVGLCSLYSIENPGFASPQTSTGFVAVGSGADHASALFMRQGYHRGWSPERTILLAYTAKKHAEIDPYVGAETDVYLIGPAENPYSPLRTELYEMLRDLYDESLDQEARNTGDTYEKFEQRVGDFLASQHPQEPDQQEGIQLPPAVEP